MVCVDGDRRGKVIVLPVGTSLFVQLPLPFSGQLVRCTVEVTDLPGHTTRTVRTSVSNNTSLPGQPVSICPAGAGGSIVGSIQISTHSGVTTSCALYFQDPAASVNVQINGTLFFIGQGEVIRYESAHGWRRHFQSFNVGRRGE